MNNGLPWVSFPFNSVCEERTYETEQNVHFSSYGQASASVLAKLSNVILTLNPMVSFTLNLIWPLKSIWCADKYLPVCPPQLPRLHSPGLTLTIDSLCLMPSQSSLLLWALKICCCLRCCPQQNYSSWILFTLPKCAHQ